MARIAMMIGGALVNAFAFTGSGYLFKALDKNGYIAEVKRHDLAQERLQKASTEWEEHRKHTIDVVNLQLKREHNAAVDFVNLQLKREHNAAVDFQNADYALTLYNQLHPTNTQIIRKKPQLSDYYTPSNEFNNYEYLWIILGMGGVGFIIYKYS